MGPYQVRPREPADTKPNRVLTRGRGRETTAVAEADKGGLRTVALALPPAGLSMCMVA
jgi:hypothetical protein